jgi:ABC-type uncharacterized transport system substrate-binding protein
MGAGHSPEREANLPAQETQYVRQSPGCTSVRPRRPEANLTGSTFFLPQLNAKRLELLKEACPRISRAAALSNPENPVSRPIIPAMQAAAESLSLIVEVVRAQSAAEVKT